jgi:hypothetical protein
MSAASFSEIAEKRDPVSIRKCITFPILEEGISKKIGINGCLLRIIPENLIAGYQELQRELEEHSDIF